MMIAVMTKIVIVMTTITNRRKRQQMKNGFLISFEGGEACGKSTQIKRFKEYLENRKVDNFFTREPGGTELGENIRNILLHFGGKMTTEALSKAILLSHSTNILAVAQEKLSFAVKWKGFLFSLPLQNRVPKNALKLHHNFLQNLQFCMFCLFLPYPKLSYNKFMDEHKKIFKKIYTFFYQ